MLVAGDWAMSGAGVATGPDAVTELASAELYDPGSGL